MRFSILHVSDLHRDLTDEIGNPWLLESLERDYRQYESNEPEILKPKIGVVSGDLIYGVKPNEANVVEEMERQYEQAEAFLVGLTDRFFGGDRDRLVLLPGNHDVCYADVIDSFERIDIPAEPEKKKVLVAELFAPNSKLRWSWNDLCFYRIADENKYCNRFRFFSTFYERFYQGRRKFSLKPESQYDVFDFPDLGFSLATLNSCYNNDPLRKAGAFHPTALTQALQELTKAERVGWLSAAAWHHNYTGGPSQDDYLDVELFQIFIDAGVSLGFHGHQHLPDCVDERYKIGLKPRKMTIVSAGTLCAGPHYLPPGIPRGYNIVELDTDRWAGRVHLRHMTNRLNGLPLWGPGYFNATNTSYIDFDLCQPLASRPAQLDEQLTLDKADKLIAADRWSEAVNILGELKNSPMSRPLLVKALYEIDDARRTIDLLWPPQSTTEVVAVGGAILEDGNREEAEAFLGLEMVAKSQDASIREITQRIRERRLR